MTPTNREDSGVEQAHPPGFLNETWRIFAAVGFGPITY